MAFASFSAASGVSEALLRRGRLFYRRLVVEGLRRWLLGRRDDRRRRRGCGLDRRCRGQAGAETARRRGGAARWRGARRRRRRGRWWWRGGARRRRRRRVALSSRGRSTAIPNSSSSAIPAPIRTSRRRCQGRSRLANGGRMGHHLGHAGTGGGRRSDAFISTASSRFSTSPDS